MASVLKIIGLLITIIVSTIIFEIATGFNFHYLINKKKYKSDNLDLDLSYYSNDCKLLIKNKIIKGMNIAKKSKIVICCLARNIEKNFELLIKRLQKTASNFSDYRIIFFENDSTDNTRKLINNFSKYNKKVILLDCCNFEGNCNCNLKNMSINKDIVGTFENERINKMALYRNQYLNYVKNNLADFDYMMVIDSDLNGPYSNYGLFHSLSFNDWDIIISSIKAPLFGSFGLFTIIYDSLAYEDYNNELENIKERSNLIKEFKKWYLMNFKSYKSSRKCELLKVKSGFNGLAIYKVKSVLKSKYHGGRCEHTSFHYDMYKKGYNKVYLNPLLDGITGYQGPIGNGLRSFTSLFS